MRCDSRRHSCDDDLLLPAVSFLDRFLLLTPAPPATAVDELRLSVSEMLLLDALHTMPSTYLFHMNIVHEYTQK